MRERGGRAAGRRPIRAPGGHSRRRVLWVALLWMAMAALPFLTGCLGTSSYADDPAPDAVTTLRDYPTAYPPADPAPGDFVLRWDGTLHPTSGVPGPR